MSAVVLLSEDLELREQAFQRHAAARSSMRL
jgi:hypothetical protein